jgi:hypothetical protein
MYCISPIVTGVLVICFMCDYRVFFFALLFQEKSRCKRIILITKMGFEFVHTDSEVPRGLLSALIKKKRKFSSYRILGNSDGIGCKFIYEEGLFNIRGNAQIFSHIGGGR